MSLDPQSLLKAAQEFVGDGHKTFAQVAFERFKRYLARFDGKGNYSHDQFQLENLPDGLWESLPLHERAAFEYAARAVLCYNHDRFIGGTALTPTSAQDEKAQCLAEKSVRELNNEDYFEA